MPTLPDAFAYVVWLAFLISSKLFDGLAMPDPFAFLHGSALPDVFAYVVWLAFLISSELFDGLALPDPFAFLDGMALATIVLAGTILLVSLDDFYIDLFYWLRRIKRALTHKRVYRPLTVEALRGEPQKPIAIMVPAWHEHDVIAMMVENLVSTVEYTNYVVFVGTYPNDQPTIDEVERVTRRYRQVHRVEIPHGGPTSKADCLNWVVQAIFAHERLAGEDFAGCATTARTCCTRWSWPSSTTSCRAWTSSRSRSRRWSATTARWSPEPTWTSLPSGTPRTWSYAR
jgi:hypothetical protein